MAEPRFTETALASMDADAVEATFADLDADALEVLVRRANREYWVERNATLPDPLYDRLVEALRRLRPDAPILDELGEPVPEGATLGEEALTDVAPAERLGAPVRHLRPMLSLEKAYSAEEVETWATKFEGEILVMPKLDGIACSLRYGADGKLRLAATRGSGTEGEDITVNALRLATIPNELANGEKNLEVRGEIFMRLSVFERYREEFSNPRNLTAGAIKNKDPNQSASYGLTFFPYGCEPTDDRVIPHERDKLELLWSLGFDHEGYTVEFVERGKIAESFQHFAETRPQLDYEIDGVVYRAALTAEQERLGATAHHPRWSIAYKFQGDTGQTRLDDIEWSVSRTGRITPVARLVPIELSGAMISRASLHNLSRFKALGMSRGALVEVTRRGGVIPMVERVVEPGPEAEPFEIPTQCPACENGVEIRMDHEAEVLMCLDPAKCTQARLADIEHFAKVVDIQGFGPKIVAQAFDRELLREPEDFYRLTLEDLQSMERLGRKSAQNLVDQVEAHRAIPLATFLRALGVEHLGSRYAKTLALRYRTLDAVLAATREELVQLDGVSDTLADVLIEGLAHRAERIRALRELVTVLDETDPSPEESAAAAAETEATGALGGRSFLFTGTLEHCDRKTAQQKVLDHGGRNANAVNKSLDVLVVGQGRGAKSSKLKKAEKLVADGVELEIITESEFLDRIGEAPAPG